MGEGFKTTMNMTIGADFAVYRKETENEAFIYQIWDLAGQSYYQNVRSRFYRGAMAGICVFDVTRRESYINLPNWIEELWNNNGIGMVPLILLANKSDLANSGSVKIHEVQAYADALTTHMAHKDYRVHCLETSASTGENVAEAFDLIGKQVLDAVKRGALKT